MLRKLAATILQSAAFILNEMSTSTSNVNKYMYIANKRSCYMLKLAAKFGSVSDFLYIAMYYYETFRYREALPVLMRAKVKHNQV